MTSIKRFDRLDVATSDLTDAVAVYQRNFGLSAKLSTDKQSATVPIGDAEIALVPAPAPDAEGMSGVWLETDDVDAVSAALAMAGYSSGPIRVTGSRRVLSVDPKSANQVTLLIFDRKV